MSSSTSLMMSNLLRRAQVHHRFSSTKSIHTKRENQIETRIENISQDGVRIKIDKPDRFDHDLLADLPH